MQHTLLMVCLQLMSKFCLEVSREWFLTSGNRPSAADRRRSAFELLGLADRPHVAESHAKLSPAVELRERAGLEPCSREMSLLTPRRSMIDSKRRSRFYCEDMVELTLDNADEGAVSSPDRVEGARGTHGNSGARAGIRANIYLVQIKNIRIQ